MKDDFLASEQINQSGFGTNELVGLDRKALRPLPSSFFVLSAAEKHGLERLLDSYHQYFVRLAASDEITVRFLDDLASL